MDLSALLEKKKKAQENNKTFLKPTKAKPNTNNKMPVRKTGRGK